MRGKRNSFIGSLAAGLLSIFGKSPAKPAPDDLARMEFKTSTQRLGIRFSERIRNVFRFRWIKVSDKANARQSCHSVRKDSIGEQSEESHRLD